MFYRASKGEGIGCIFSCYTTRRLNLALLEKVIGGVLCDDLMEIYFVTHRRLDASSRHGEVNLPTKGEVILVGAREPLPELWWVLLSFIYK